MQRSRSQGFIAVLISLLLLHGLLFLSPAYGQGPLGDVTGRSGEEKLPVPEAEAAPPKFEVQPPKPPAPGAPAGVPVTAIIKEIRIKGNTVFAAEQLAEVTATYLNRELTSEDLEALRTALTVFYINHGYINSGAVIPDQAISEAILTVRIIEGRLSQIDVEGNRLFRPEYLVDRIRPPPCRPLNIHTIQERLQILQQDDRIVVVNAELRPGAKPGEASLGLKVKEENWFRAYLDFSNYQSPTVGAETGLLTLQHMSLTGRGDMLSFSYGASRGIDPRIETFYTLPVNRADGTLTFEYRKNDFSVVEEPFHSLNIESKSDIYGVSFRQPVYRTVRQELALGLAGEYLYNKTYLDKESFSFYPGVQDGRSAVSAIRAFQEWIYRSVNQVIALRSRLSFGVDAFDSTINGDNLPDSRFLSWMFQFRGARRHNLFGLQTLVRIDGQLTPDSLLPLEQISVGGRYSVRGYRENQLVRDNGVIASMEERLPIIRNKRWASVIELCAFYDFGHAWNTNLPTPSPRTLDSVGLGVRWGLARPPQTHLQPMFELYWGVPLRSVETQGGNLQDSGIHFRFVAMYW